MKRKMIYLSGPISGLREDQVRNGFKRAAEYVEGMYWDKGIEALPVSPLDNGMPTDATYGQHMKADLIMLMGCDAIFMSSGWERSRGCMTEHSVASALGMEIIYEHKHGL